MIRKIVDILKEKGKRGERTYSFEFFPPKTDKGKLKLFERAGVYTELKPDWFSVTYGAGGTTRAMTMEIADEIQKSTDIPVMHHFTCVGHSKAELKTILTEMKSYFS